MGAGFEARGDGQEFESRVVRLTVGPEISNKNKEGVQLHSLAHARELRLLGRFQGQDLSVVLV